MVRFLLCVEDRLDLRPFDISRLLESAPYPRPSAAPELFDLPDAEISGALSSTTSSSSTSLLLLLLPVLGRLLLPMLS